MLRGHVGDEVPIDAPDFTIVERTFERRMREQGLSPRRLREGVDSGYSRLEVYCTNAEVLALRENDLRIASVEVKVVLDHPVHGSAEILDLVTLRGESAEAALERCAHTWMDVAFPALRSLFEGKLASGSAAVDLSSYTPALGKTIRWQVYTGELQIDAADARLAQFLVEQPPVALILDTLCNFLALPELHWCKLYAAMKPKGLVVGCVIDGTKSLQAEAEMHEKLSAAGDLPPTWELRQFLLMHPAGEATEMEADLRRHHEQRYPDEG